MAKTPPLGFQKRRPPPNYFARSVQVRMMILVVTLLTVLVMIGKAADPATWSWMWSGSPAAVQNAAASAPRAGWPATLQPPPPAIRDPLMADAFQTRDRPIEPPASEMDSIDIQATILLDAWREVWSKLSESHAQRLERSLRADRLQRAMDDDDREDWVGTLSLLDEHWLAYLDHAATALQDLDEVPRIAWEKTLREARETWTAGQRPALAALVRGPLDAEYRSQMDKLQTLLRQLAMEQIEDDAPLRRRESRAWVRILDDLNQASADQLERLSIGPVGYLEIYRQPDVYRGRVVTVNGQARLGYSVSSPSDDDPQRRLHVLWIKPSAGPNAPLAVYFHQLPQGFPTLADGDQGRETELNETVVLHAVFFKRFAYAARQGIQTAPLLLAHQPQWRPLRPMARLLPPSLPWVIGIVVGAALLAWAISWRASRGDGPRSVELEPPTADEWKTLREARSSGSDARKPTFPANET